MIIIKISFSYLPNPVKTTPKEVVDSLNLVRGTTVVVVQGLVPLVARALKCLNHDARKAAASDDATGLNDLMDALMPHLVRLMAMDRIFCGISHLPNDVDMNTLLFLQDDLLSFAEIRTAITVIVVL